MFWQAMGSCYSTIKLMSLDVLKIPATVLQLWRMTWRAVPAVVMRSIRQPDGNLECIPWDFDDLRPLPGRMMRD